MKTCEKCLRPDVCKYAGQCLKPEEKPGSKTEDVVEMWICEVPYVGLRPGQLYRFVVMPDCEKCETAATPYQTNVERTHR